MLQLTRSAKQTLHLKFSRQMSIVDTSRLRAHLQNLRDEGNTRFLMDLSQVQKIDAAATGVLLFHAQKCAQVGGYCQWVLPKSLQVREYLSQILSMKHLSFFENTRSAMWYLKNAT
jgi:anti-anti-sigma regulatory factor